MKPIPTILILSTVALLAACAGPMGPMSGPMANQHTTHHANMPALQVRMENMRAMRDKMSSAQTPAERQALMDEHMKAMHDGMDSMKKMDGARAPVDFAQHQQQMEARMDMMQTMMEMMIQRMPR